MGTILSLFGRDSVTLEGNLLYLNDKGFELTEAHARLLAYPFGKFAGGFTIAGRSEMVCHFDFRYTNSRIFIEDWEGHRSSATKKEAHKLAHELAALVLKKETK